MRSHPNSGNQGCCGPLCVAVWGLGWVERVERESLWWRSRQCIPKTIRH